MDWSWTPQQQKHNIAKEVWIWGKKQQKTYKNKRDLERFKKYQHLAVPRLIIFRGWCQLPKCGTLTKPCLPCGKTLNPFVQGALGGVHLSIFLLRNCCASCFFQFMYLHQSTESSTRLARWTWTKKTVGQNGTSLTYPCQTKILQVSSILWQGFICTASLMEKLKAPPWNLAPKKTLTNTSSHLFIIRVRKTTPHVSHHFPLIKR